MILVAAFVFLSKSLFTTYTYQDTSSEHDLADELPPPPTFQISLPALLETLQIFTLNDAASKSSGEPYDAFTAARLNRHANQPFSSSVLGTSGLCRLSYQGPGSALSVHLTEAGVSTTCDLTTYESSWGEEDIPFDRDSLTLKTIMRSTHLADAVTELASANPTTLSLLVNPERAPHLSLSATGPLGSATVEFARDPQLLETFQCERRFSSSYKFALVKAAQRAMTSATKVSLRTDEQGVLSLQFLIEVEAGGLGGEGIAFVDFRIVPLVEGEGEAGVRGGGESGESTDDE